MAGIRQRMACRVALLLIGVGIISAHSRAQSSSGQVADDAVKKSQDPFGVSIQSAPKLAVDGEFQSAPALFRLGKFAEAERQFAWIADVRKGTSWGERSQYYLAECQYHLKRYMEALESFERLRADYPATEYCDQLVRREYEIAQLWITRAKPVVLTAKKAFLLSRFAVPPMADTEEWALRALSAVRQNDPTGPLADDACIQIADHYLQTCNYDTAAAYYDQFIAEFPKSPFRTHAQLGAVEARFRIYLLN